MSGIVDDLALVGQQIKALEAVVSDTLSTVAATVQKAQATLNGGGSDAPAATAKRRTRRIDRRRQANNKGPRLKKGSRLAGEFRRAIKRLDRAMARQSHTYMDVAVRLGVSDRAIGHWVVKRTLPVQAHARGLIQYVREALGEANQPAA